MSGLIYALALFGCSDDATACERLSDKAQTYESRVACQMAAVTELQGDVAMRADFPTVIGKCMTQGQLVQLGDKPVNLNRVSERLAFNAR